MHSERDPRSLAVSSASEYSEKGIRYLEDYSQLAARGLNLQLPIYEMGWKQVMAEGVGFEPTSP